MFFMYWIFLPRGNCTAKLPELTKLWGHVLHETRFAIAYETHQCLAVARSIRKSDWAFRTSPAQAKIELNDHRKAERVGCSPSRAFLF